jgi:hypothetical protein
MKNIDLGGTYNEIGFIKLETIVEQKITLSYARSHMLSLFHTFSYETIVAQLL